MCFATEDQMIQSAVMGSLSIVIGGDVSGLDKAATKAEGIVGKLGDRYIIVERDYYLKDCGVFTGRRPATAAGASRRQVGDEARPSGTGLFGSAGHGGSATMTR